MSRSSFSKAYEEITNLESMEMTFTINDADLDKLNEILKDINVKECPWFEIRDKHGNKAKYYREQRKRGKWELRTDERFDIDYYKCSECGYEPYRKMDISNFCPNCGADMRESDG